MAKRGRPALPPEKRKPRLTPKQRREKKEAEEAASAGLPPPVIDDTDESGNGNDEWAKDFEEAGDPDLENPDTDLAYVRKLQLICLRQMATTARPPKHQQDAWRRIREMSAVVGMTSNRAKLEAEVKALKDSLRTYQEKSSALRSGTGTGVQKSPAARGQRRGPRPVPEEPDKV